MNIYLKSISLLVSLAIVHGALAQERGTERVYDPKNPSKFVNPNNPGGGPNLLAPDLVFNPAPRPAAPVAPVDITRPDIQDQIKKYNDAVEANNKWNQENISRRNQALANTPYSAFQTYSADPATAPSVDVVTTPAATTTVATSQSSSIAGSGNQVQVLSAGQPGSNASTPSVSQYVVNGQQINSPTYSKGFNTSFDYGGQQYVSTGSKITANQALEVYAAANADLKIKDPDRYNLESGRVYEAAQMAAMTAEQRAAFDAYQSSQSDQEYINVNGSFVRNPNYAGGQASVSVASATGATQTPVDNGVRRISGAEIANSSAYGCAVVLCLAKPDEPTCAETLQKLHSQLKNGGGMPICKK